jgi:predicted DNA-binding ribbon-helix-helix protein
MQKKSISLDGHRTSVRLEPEFWAVLERAAADRRLSLPALVESIDRDRLQSAPAPNLASALRVFALRFLSRAGDERERRPSENELRVKP